MQFKCLGWFDYLASRINLTSLTILATSLSSARFCSFCGLFLEVNLTD